MALRDLAESASPHANVRASALLVQANLLAERIQWWDYLNQNEVHVQIWESDPETRLLIANFKDSNLDDLQQQVVTKATRLKTVYGDLKRQGFVTNIQSFSMRRHASDSMECFGELAERILYQTMRLRAGQTVPDFEDTNVDGSPFKLSDFRGKVLMLTFSADWCGPCKAMYPERRDLVKSLEGRPFELISLMGDDNADTVAEAHASGDITRLTTWDGKRGPIVLKWNINSWPTVLIIDDHGVVRSTVSSKVDRMSLIAELVKQAEE